MQQHKSVEDYLNSVIPDKISDRIKAELRAELECHIYDKADFYISIGYDEETAIKKSVDEMGETESVKTKFGALYIDSTLKGVLLFLSMCTINLLSVSMFGLGYWYLVEPSMQHFPSLTELAVFLTLFIFFTVYTIKCCREKLHKQLTGLSSAYGLMALASFITSGLFYPVFNAGGLVYRYMTNGHASERDLSVFVNIIVLIVYAIFSFWSLSRECRFRKKPYRLSLNQITVILSIISVFFIVVYGLAYAKYEYSYFDEDMYAESSQETYLSSITSEQKNIYDTINGGDDATQTMEMLTDNGFVKQNINYKKYICDNYRLPFWVKDYLLEKNPESVIKNSEYAIFCYTCGMDDEEDYGDIISSIVISYDSNNKIIYKLFIPDTEGWTVNRSYYNYGHGESTQKWFNNLQNGENSESALEFIRKTDSYIIEDEKYDGDNTLNTYKILMQCHYNFDATFVDFLLGASPDSMDYNFDLEIKAENGTLTDFTSVENE